MTDRAPDLQAKLRTDLRTAMLARRKDEVAALRSLIAAIDNAQAIGAPGPGGGGPIHRFGDDAVEVPRQAMSNDDLNMLLRNEISSRRTAADEYRGAGHLDRVACMTYEADIIARYLR